MKLSSIISISIQCPGADVGNDTEFRTIGCTEDARKCYYIYKTLDEKRNWDTVRSRCEENGMMMATIQTQQEASVISDAKVEGNYWLGGLQTDKYNPTWLLSGQPYIGDEIKDLKGTCIHNFMQDAGATHATLIAFRVNMTRRDQQKCAIIVYFY